MDGLFWYLHLLLFFLMATPVFEKDYLKFLSVNSIAGLLTGAYALTSKFWPEAINFGDQTRLGGTFGNPAFLATYFLALFFLNAILFLLYQGPQKKLFAGMCVLSLVLVAMSGTRGAWIGSAVGLILFAGLILIFKGKQYLKFGVAVLAILVLLFASFKFLPKVWERVSPFFASRIYGLWEIPKPRQIVWGIGWEAFKDHPIFGWGLENFIYAYNKHFVPDLHTYEMSTFDRPHNKIIDLLASTGIVGFLSYLSLFAVLTWQGLRSLLRLRSLRLRSGQAPQVAQNNNSDKDFLVKSLFLSLLGAYFVQNLVLFEMPTSGIVFFLILSLGSWLFFNSEQSPKQSKPLFHPNTDKNDAGMNRTLPLWFFYIVVALFVLSFPHGIIRPKLASSRTATSAFSMSPQLNPIQALKQSQDYYSQARDLNTFLNREIDISIYRRLEDFSTVDYTVGQSQELQDFAKTILANMEKDIASHPNDYDMVIGAAAAASRSGIDATTTDPLMTKAYGFLEKAVLMAPKREDAYQHLFLRSLRNGFQEKAKGYADTLLGLNDKIGLFWFYQAEYEARWGNVEKMNQFLEGAKKLGYDAQQNLGGWERLISSLILNNQHRTAVAQLELLVKTPNLPLDLYIRNNLLLIEEHLKFGDRAKARSAIQALVVGLPEEYKQEMVDYLKQNYLWIE
jgi:O-antigen ligase